MAPTKKRKVLSLPSQRAGKRTRKDVKSDAAEKGRSASFNDLPEELIVNIVDHLPGIDDDCDSPDDEFENPQLPMLIALSATSRQLHRLVIDRVYESYHSSYADPYLFPRTLITSPNLGMHVRSASFKYVPSRKRYTPNAQDKKIVNPGIKAVLKSPVWKTWGARCDS